MPDQEDQSLEKEPEQKPTRKRTGKPVKPKKESAPEPGTPIDGSFDLLGDMTQEVEEAEKIMGNEPELSKTEEVQAELPEIKEVDGDALDALIEAQIQSEVSVELSKLLHDIETIADKHSRLALMNGQKGISSDFNTLLHVGRQIAKRTRGVIYWTKVQR